ncbi:hypothetical protein A3A36_02110 [Candidatus Kaiserbacteria bacterium RIFCSPLOWO2_01_FULL_52_12b]|uniref:Uncharacterized protein n=1 Tax=Candidatus Kaiserbacteria bacterium RIFCSPLOWO2_01_FULL_52_12b TaxID=1798509 RepID=A0A1F6EXD8_9BACT|nr:MAG: hypothetical protein A3A36_02110 [Candidatus Kaiserbacteria bacterium RIFCSPLOWO2_01_FULL_52_12b]
MKKGDEKFLEVLDRFGIPTDLKCSSVAMNRETGSGKVTATFYGVGKPIPSEIVHAIKTEVIPLLVSEQVLGWEYENVISDEVLKLSEPDRRQDGWNKHCQIINMMDGR